MDTLQARPCALGVGRPWPPTVHEGGTSPPLRIVVRASRDKRKGTFVSPALISTETVLKGQFDGLGRTKTAITKI